MIRLVNKNKIYRCTLYLGFIQYEGKVCIHGNFPSIVVEVDSYHAHEASEILATSGNFLCS